MKKNILLAFVLLTTAQAFAQTKTDSTQQQQAYMNMYRRSLEYDDMSSAAYALTGYLMHGGAAQFKDTLAVVYYRLGNLNGAYKMANEINQANPKDITALTLLADITGRAGDTKASLDWYEKLCALSPEPYNFYQLATRQFLLERIGECKASLNKVVADSAKARQEKVSLEISAGNNEAVPVLAAAYNMLGALAFREKQNAEAKRFYELAVKEFPEFVIARQNLQSMQPASPKPVAGKPAAKPKKQ
ncbi:tetratricopeptide repeat protein [Phnomibacter sp. MR]|uniref:tetratricopeptide repeat protein n=1 Tax=Phnomibacter sp. MR TaxID=3042318 RepID=UPI003A7FFCFE